MPLTTGLIYSAFWFRSLQLACSFSPTYTHDITFVVPGNPSIVALDCRKGIKRRKTARNIKLLCSTCKYAIWKLACHRMHSHGHSRWNDKYLQIYIKDNLGHSYIVIELCVRETGLQTALKYDYAKITTLSPNLMNLKWVGYDLKA